MTIGEHLQREVRTGHRVKWIGVLAVVVVVFQQIILKHSNAETYAWEAVVVTPWLIAVSVLGRRLKCPRCQKNLYKELAYSAPMGLALLRTAKQELFGREALRLEACPQCGCRFSEPHVGG